jgi:hypothetical protein
MLQHHGNFLPIDTPLSFRRHLFVIYLLKSPPVRKAAFPGKRPVRQDHPGGTTPDQETAALPRRGGDPHLRGLTGDRAAVDAALKAYRVYAKKIPLKDGDYTMDHTAVVYLMDKGGRFVATFNLKQTPEAAAAQLRGYL